MFYQLNGLSYTIPGTLPTANYAGNEEDGWMVRNPAPNAGGGKTTPKKKEKSDCEKLKDFQRTFPSSWQYMVPGSWITKCKGGSKSSNRSSSNRGTRTDAPIRSNGRPSAESLPPSSLPSTVPDSSPTESSPMPTANLPPAQPARPPLPSKKWGWIAAAGIGAFLLLKKK